jgi:hypothetical protein
VEGLVGYVRRNFMTPLPVAESFDAFNARLVDACTKRRQAILRGHRTTIAERMQADLAAFMKLPPAPYDACDKVNTRVSWVMRNRSGARKKNASSGSSMLRKGSFTGFCRRRSAWVTAPATIAR